MLYLTLRQYEYIVSVADAGSLTEAASLLNVSQPSLSVAITRVEDRLEAKVFLRRKGTPIEITPFGHGLIAQARTLLQLAGSIEKGPEVAPPFVLGCFEDIAPWHLAPALKKLQAHFPTTEFRGHEGRFSNLAAALRDGRIDLALSYDIGFEGKFERQIITSISPVAFLATDHPLAGQSSLTLKELINHPMILSTESLSEGFVRKLFGDMHQKPMVKQRATSLEMMRSLAAHGVGVGISYSRPPSDISYDRKPLVTIPISTPEARTGIALLWSSLRVPNVQFAEICAVLGNNVPA